MLTQGNQLTKVAALMVGAAVIGAGVGLLYSPQSGIETRRQIRHYAKKSRIQGTRYGRSVKSGVDRAIQYSKSILPKKENSSAPVAA